MIGRSSSPSNCRPPCIAIWSPTPRSLRKNTVRQSNPSSLCRRCSHGSCRRIVYLLAYGAQRAAPVEFDDGHHADVAEAAAAACSMALEGIAVLSARCPERARLTEWQSRSRLEETKRVSHLPLHALIVECESALKWDPGRFRHTALKFRTKSRQGWGPYRRRSGPHLRAQIARYFNSLWSIWRGVPLQC